MDVAGRVACEYKATCRASLQLITPPSSIRPLLFVAVSPTAIKGQALVT